MMPLELMIFYLLAGAGCWILFSYCTKQILFSAALSILLVFVSSEFWEIPIFFMAYLGAPGYGSPEILNHILVFFMAALLILLTDFRLTYQKGFWLILDLILNIIALLIIPGVISPWILRAASLWILLSVFLEDLS